MKVAFQGARGAYSEEALYRYFPEHVEAVGFDLSEQVFEAVENQEVAMGILPVENSIAGNVAVNMDLMFRHQVFCIGEIYHPIRHCLLGNKGASLNDINKAHSHPIALMQCREFFKKEEIQPIQDFDTAGSCVGLVERAQKDEATVASKLCAKHYDLELLAEDIQTISVNITRFLVFVREHEIPDGINQQKTSLAFSAGHHPGALLNCLQIFKEFDLNLTRLESRPIPENPFEYIFFVDFLGGLNEERTQQCLLTLKSDAHQIKVLGSYPEGKKIIP